MKMSVGIAGDHGGFELKQELITELSTAEHRVVDFGAYERNTSDDYPDYIIPLAEAVASGRVDRGVALCTSAVGASVCANKIAGIRAGVVSDHFSTWKGVEDNHMNIICLDPRITSGSVAWDLIQTFLAAEFSGAEQHRRRLRKIVGLEKRASGD